MGSRSRLNLYPTKNGYDTSTILALPNVLKMFVIECAASGGNMSAIDYFSQALHGRNLALSTYDKEMLALVVTMQNCRPYLLG